MLTRTGYIVIDAGPPDESHLARVAAVGTVELILLTHGHPDHSGGSARLAELTGAPVLALDRQFGEPLQAGDSFHQCGVHLEVISTPGHSADSLSFYLPDDNAVLTGDTILGRGTTVVAWPDGELGPYLESLKTLREYGDAAVLPGHGPELPSAGRVAEEYLAHRAERLAQVAKAVAGGAHTPREVVEIVYVDVPEVLWPAAELSVHAQLDHLVKETPGARRPARSHSHPRQRARRAHGRGQPGAHRRAPRLIAMTSPPPAGLPTASTGPLRCPTCSTPTVANARFCHVCGMPLTTERVDESAERRVVTVLFGDLSDFTAWAEDLDPERVGEVTDRVLAALARVVVEVGGHVDKLTGDGIMAVFGAPTAHEDDAERAVRAAVNMQHEVSRLIADELGGGRRLGLRVGLNTGEVLAGVQAALAYTVVGDTVNTASRLSDAASVGSIYAGRDTAVATMTLASWRALQPLRLKGKREPVAAYELVALRPTSAGQLGLGDEAPFVGRETEVARLVGASLDVTESGSPATIYVSGEAGVGKTRTVGELVRFAGEIPDGRVLLGRAMPYGEGRHLAPLVELVRTACGITDEDEPEVAVERVHRTLARLDNPAPSLWVPGALADRLLHLLGIEHDVDGSSSRDGSPADPHGRDGVLDATATLLRALAVEGPLLVVLDDLQWASDVLLDAIGEVAKRLRGPILLVLIGREPEIIADLPSPRQVMLDPLDESTAHRLLRAYLGGGDLADPLRSAMLSRAQGNPYFLAELLHLLVDRGLLQREGDSWVASGPLPADALPAAVQAVLAARIDGLDPTSKSVLRAASVLGLRFAAEALGVVDQRSTEEVQAALTELTARQLVHPPNKGEIWWTFTHPMARDVAYGSLPKADRARRHARAAQWAAERGARVGSTHQVDPFVGAQAEQALELAKSMRLPADDPVREVRFVGYAGLGPPRSDGPLAR